MTHVTFEIDISGKADDVARLWRQTVEVSCPHCGERHLEGFKQLYLHAVVKTDNWDDALSAPPRTPQRRQNALR